MQVIPNMKKLKKNKPQSLLHKMYLSVWQNIREQQQDMSSARYNCMSTATAIFFYKTNT